MMLTTVLREFVFTDSCMHASSFLLTDFQEQNAVNFLANREVTLGK